MRFAHFPPKLPNNSEVNPALSSETSALSDGQPQSIAVSAPLTGSYCVALGLSKPGCTFARTRLHGLLRQNRTKAIWAEAMWRRALSVLLLPLALAACSGDDSGPVRVDMIGEPPDLADPSRSPPTPAAELLLAETAEGLVALNEEGQIVPALARRWIVIDDGLSYIFRLDDREWDDGTALTAGQLARQLHSARRPGSRNRLARLLGDIDSVNAVTPQILEITLRRQRVDFLQLLAQPDLAIFIDGGGLGPFRIADGYDAQGDSPMLLSPVQPPQGITDESPPPVAPSDTVELRFVSAATAVARFSLGQSDLVLGGDWTTLPYTVAIGPSAAQLTLDPVEGLFGLVFVEQTGFLAVAANRDLLSQAIDRQRIAELFSREEAEPRAVIIAGDAEGLAGVVLPVWLDEDQSVRERKARDAVSRWRGANGDIGTLRVALPDAPGSRILFAVVRANWAAIGVSVERVEWRADADLRLIDRVAATDSATWYLDQFACDRGLPCSEAFDTAMKAYDEATSLRVRAIRIAEAATALQAMTPFIPLLRPIRWSLVASRMTGFQPNRQASHPFSSLAAPAR